MAIGSAPFLIFIFKTVIIYIESEVKKHAKKQFEGGFDFLPASCSERVLWIIAKSNLGE